MANNLILLHPDETMLNQIAAYRQEMLNVGSSMDGTSGLAGYEQPKAWLEHVRAIEHTDTCPPHLVTATLFLGVRKSDGCIVGMIDLRHRLNDFLAEFGGHIGYSVRPKERCKGYAKEMLALALAEARERGLFRVLITCNDDNAGSARTIEANGGIFERYAQLDGEVLRRYWINL